MVKLSTDTSSHVFSDFAFDDSSWYVRKIHTKKTDILIIMICQWRVKSEKKWILKGQEVLYKHIKKFAFKVNYSVTESKNKFVLLIYSQLYHVMI